MDRGRRSMKEALPSDPVSPSGDRHPSNRAGVMPALLRHAKAAPGIKPAANQAFVRELTSWTTPLQAAENSFIWSRISFGVASVGTFTGSPVLL